jgi:hypothetical protein
MDEDFNPKMKAKGSSFHSYNQWYLGMPLRLGYVA